MRDSSHKNPYELLSQKFTQWAGSVWAFFIACGLIVGWFLAGTAYDFSSRWHNNLNTLINIITFCMIFLMQRSENKEYRATQVKLDEIIKALEGAKNPLINIEHASDEEITRISRQHQRQARQ